MTLLRMVPKWFREPNLDVFRFGVRSQSCTTLGAVLRPPPTAADLSKDRQLEKFVAHGGQVRSVHFSRDGSRLVSGSSDGNLRTWGACYVSFGKYACCRHLRPLSLIAVVQTWPLSVFSSPEETTSLGRMESLALLLMTTGWRPGPLPGASPYSVCNAVPQVSCSMQRPPV